jgi:hypothetical protein
MIVLHVSSAAAVADEAGSRRNHSETIDDTQIDDSNAVPILSNA